MRKLLSIMLLFPAAAFAQEYQRLDSAAISQALNGHTVAFEGATQRFLGQGRTLYDNGSENWGKWKVENGQYCSQWPPADGWTCYDVERSGDRLRFLGQGGEKEGRLSQ